MWKNKVSPPIHNKVTPEQSGESSQSFQSWSMESFRFKEMSIRSDVWTSHDIFEDYRSSNDALYKSFCPHILPSLFRNLSGPETISQQTFRFDGFCMLADISGFTKLSSKLCDMGPKGLDRLRNIINNYFKSLVDNIIACGGDVVSFAGDALICVFRPEGQSEDELRECALKAASCAIQISSRPSDHEGIVAHVGLTCGNINFSVIGGHADQWVHVITGDGVDALSSCLEDAGPHEAVISESVHAVLPEDMVEVEEVNGVSKQYKLLRVDTSVEDGPGSPCAVAWGRHHGIAGIMTFVPRPALSAISANLLEGLSELRNVTTMFVKLDDYSTGETLDVKQLHSYLVAMQKCLMECGGFLRQFLVDDKGCVLIGIWGVPCASFANNCSRAVRCAVMMSHRAETLGHSISVGVSNGTAYCGVIGSETRQDYVAIGKSVNLAARLMGKAHGQVYIDARTFEHLPLEISHNLREVTPQLELKGFVEPIVSYCYASSLEPILSNGDTLPQKDPKLFLNRVVLNGIDSALCIAANIGPSNQTDNGYRTGLFVVKGLAGMGKTTVATVFSQQCMKASSLATSYVLLNPLHSTNPYHAITSLIFDLIGDGNFKTVEQQQTVVNSLLQQTYSQPFDSDFIAEKFLILKQVLGLDWSLLKPISDSNPCEESLRRPSVSLTRSNSALSGGRSVSVAVSGRSFLSPRFGLRSRGRSATIKDNEEELCDTLVEVLCAMLETAVGRVIIIDNSHFMHASSWKVLTRLCQFNARCIILLTITGGAASKRSQELSSITVPQASSPATNRSTVRNMHFLASSASMAVAESLDDEDMFGASSALDHVVHLKTLMDACGGVVVEIRLEPLSKYMVSSFLTSHLSKENLSAAIIDEVYRISDGNPFWCWKIVQFIQDVGSVEVFASMMKYNNDALLVCVLEPLSAYQQGVLRYASVIGEVFSVTVLEKVVPVTLKSLMLELLEALVRHGLIYSTAPGSKLYRFQSSLIRELVYNLIPPSDSSQIHTEVATAIVGIYGKDDRHIVASMAYHLSMGEPHLRGGAFRYAVEAAAICLDEGRYKDAYSFIGFSLKIASSRAQLRELLHHINMGISHIENDMHALVDADRSYSDYMSELLLKYANLRDKVAASPMLVWMHLRLGKSSFTLKYCF